MDVPVKSGDRQEGSKGVPKGPFEEEMDKIRADGVDGAEEDAMETT